MWRPLSTFTNVDGTLAVTEGRCPSCDWLLEEAPFNNRSCKLRLDVELPPPERAMFLRVERIAELWTARGYMPYCFRDEDDDEDDELNAMFFMGTEQLVMDDARVSTSRQFKCVRAQ